MLRKKADEQNKELETARVTESQCEELQIQLQEMETFVETSNSRAEVSFT